MYHVQERAVTNEALAGGRCRCRSSHTGTAKGTKHRRAARRRCKSLRFAISNPQFNYLYFIAQFYKGTIGGLNAKKHSLPVNHYNHICQQRIIHLMLWLHQYWTDDSANANRFVSFSITLLTVTIIVATKVI